MTKSFHFEFGLRLRISSFLCRFSTAKVKIDKPHINLYQYSLQILEQRLKAFSNMLRK